MCEQGVGQVQSQEAAEGQACEAVSGVRVISTGYGPAPAWSCTRVVSETRSSMPVAEQLAHQRHVRGLVPRLVLTIEARDPPFPLPRSQEPCFAAFQPHLRSRTRPRLTWLSGRSR